MPGMTRVLARLQRIPRPDWRRARKRFRGAEASAAWLLLEARVILPIARLLAIHTNGLIFQNEFCQYEFLRGAGQRSAASGSLRVESTPWRHPGGCESPSLGPKADSGGPAFLVQMSRSPNAANPPNVHCRLGQLLGENGGRHDDYQVPRIAIRRSHREAQ